MPDKFKVYSDCFGLCSDDFETKEDAMNEAQKCIDLFMQYKEGFFPDDGEIYVLRVVAESESEICDYDGNAPIYDVILDDLDSGQPAIEEMRACIDELIAAIDSSSFCSECSEEFGTSACSECPWYRAKNRALRLLKKTDEADQRKESE